MAGGGGVEWKVVVKTLASDSAFLTPTGPAITLGDSQVST